MRYTESRENDLSVRGHLEETTRAFTVLQGLLDYEDSLGTSSHGP
jgi:hypothetical protein